ncbi:MAG: glutathione peroxidase, partial [Spongiibacter marinus]
MSSLYDFKINSLQGKEMNLADYAGKVVLVVNTASKC